jgi:AcrR family transcriptional regulator
LNDSYLESMLLGACPELRDSWRAHRHTFAGNDAVDDQLLLDTVRRHVLGLLAAGRVAEFSRFARAIERLLGEADPVLFELLREGLLRPLARDVREAGIAPSLVAPYLGRRMELAWPPG